MASSNVVKVVKVTIAGDSSGAQSALSSLSKKSESTAGAIKSHLSGLFSKINESGAFGGIIGQLSEVGNAFSGLELKGKSLGLKMAGIGAGIAGAGGALTMIGSKETDATNQLAQAIADTGHNVDDYQSQIDKAVTHNEKFGHTATDTKGALQALTQGLQDPQKALNSLGLVADLAAAKHESLTAAAEQMVKVYSGKGTRILAEFGIAQVKVANYSAKIAAAEKAEVVADDGVTKAKQHLADVHALLAGKTKITVAEQINLRNATDGVKTAEEKAFFAHLAVTQVQGEAAKATGAHSGAVNELAQRLKGQASAASDSWGGHLRALRAEIEDHVATLGQKYGPALTAAGAGMSLLGAAGTGLSGVLKALKGGTEAVDVAEGVQTAAEGADAAAADALAVSETAADTAGLPLILTIGLIVAAVAAVGIAIYEVVTHFKEVFGFIKGIISDAIGFISEHWQGILQILLGPIGLVWLGISKFGGDVVGFFTKLPGEIASAASGMWDWISSSFKDVINGVIDFWNSFVKHFNVDVGPVHIHWADQLTIPRLAAGGIVTSPMLALIGESGPEAVIPLSSGGGGGGGGAYSLPGGSAGGVHVGEINVTAQTNADAGDIARETTWELQRLAS